MPNRPPHRFFSSPYSPSTRHSPALLRQGPVLNRFENQMKLPPPSLLFVFPPNSFLPLTNEFPTSIHFRPLQRSLRLAASVLLLLPDRRRPQRARNAQLIHHLPLLPSPHSPVLLPHCSSPHHALGHHHLTPLHLLQHHRLPPPRPARPPPCSAQDEARVHQAAVGG